MELHWRSAVQSEILPASLFPPVIGIMLGILSKTSQVKSRTEASPTAHQSNWNDPPEIFRVVVYR